MKAIWLGSIALLAACLIAIPSAFSAAGDVTCGFDYGNPNAVTLTGTVNGNVVVPDGKVCSVDEATIKGSVYVGLGSSIFMYESDVAGVLYGNEASSVNINESWVHLAVFTYEGTVINTYQSHVGSLFIIESNLANVTETKVDTILLSNDAQATTVKNSSFNWGGWFYNNDFLILTNNKYNGGLHCGNNTYTDKTGNTGTGGDFC